LHELGARNFLVASLPPIGCLPLQLTFESFKSSSIPGIPAAPRPKKCIQDQNIGVESYNTKLQQMIQELLKEFNSKERSRAAYLDSYSIVLDMANNPQKYGKSKDNLVFFNSFILFVNFVPSYLNLYEQWIVQIRKCICYMCKHNDAIAAQG
jgi:hypothetical protein